MFLFFMITDPRTIPASGGGRRVYAVWVGLLATLLIAPWTTEFAHKVAVLGALALVCAARPVLLLVAERRAAGVGDWARRQSPAARVGAAALGVTGAMALVALAGLPARGEQAGAAAPRSLVPVVSVVSTPGLAPVVPGRHEGSPPTSRPTSSVAADALRTRDREKAGEAATGSWLADLWRRIDASHGAEIDVADLRAGADAPPTRAAATDRGRRSSSRRFTGRCARRPTAPGEEPLRETPPADVVRTFEVAERGGRFLVVGLRGEQRTGTPVAATRASFTLTDVAPSVGLDFRHGAFRYTRPGESTTRPR